MGGPKALLIVDGKPLVLHHVERLREVDCRCVAVVVRPSSCEQVVRALQGIPGVVVIPAETTSAAASLAVGLRALTPSEAGAVLVTPVDLLPAGVSTLRALLAACAVGHVRVATPRHAGRGGHPVVLRRALVNRFLHGFSGTLRDLIGSAEAYRERVDVDDVAIHGDLDTPDDLAAIQSGDLPRFAGHA